MQRLQPTRPLGAFPQLRRVHFFSPQNQDWVAAYLAHLRARSYAPSTEDNALRALTCFAVLMPAGRQATLYQDLTQTTPADLDAWIVAASLFPVTRRMRFLVAVRPGLMSPTLTARMAASLAKRRRWS